MKVIIDFHPKFTNNWTDHVDTQTYLFTNVMKANNNIFTMYLETFQSSVRNTFKGEGRQWNCLTNGN